MRYVVVAERQLQRNSNDSFSQLHIS